MRRHLSGKEPISKLAEEFGLQPRLIPNRVNQVQAQFERAFELNVDNGRPQRARDRQTEQMWAKQADKNEVIAN